MHVNFHGKPKLRAEDLCQLEFLVANNPRMSCTQRRSNYRAIDASDERLSEDRVQLMAMLVGQAI